MRRSLLWVALLGAGALGWSSAGDLDQGFQSPPPSARPWVYWFFLNGNLAKEGMTADLEAMARVGIGGVLSMEVDQGAPNGKADFAGPLWMDMWEHATREAERLGLEINMNNDAGWNGSGGPWITPEMSMQKVVWSEAIMERADGSPTPEIVLPQPAAVNGYYKDITVMAMPAPAVDERIDNIAEKAAFVTKSQAPLPASFPAAKPGAAIPHDKIIDISKSMDAAGKLIWNAPPGKWLLMRFGHTTTGKNNLPAPATGRGLECDKCSREAATLHFNNLMGRLIERNKSRAGKGKTLISTHIDSWENGSQNWTPLMREEFRKRRGYDILTYLPVMAGRIVDSGESSERFLWDLRRTISDLLLDNYAGTFRDLAHRNGLRLSIEAYDRPPTDDLAFAGRCDEPMGEFWAWPKFGAAYSCTEMTSAAHIYGKPVVGAEAFTSGKDEKWLGHPGNIKELGDWAFCEGINRFVFHRYAAQPWLNLAPGMGMGPWGLHYERTQTWWEQSKAWHLYLARCQYLLQKGKFVADIVYLMPESSPLRASAPPEAEIAPHIRGGYNFDLCPAEAALTRMTVKDGRLMLPDGMNYRVLVLPKTETMTPAMIRKIREFADAGAMIVGPDKPPVKGTGLADKGAGDQEVRATAATLWASGKIVTGKTAQQLLADTGVPQDFSAKPLLRHIHRKIGDADVYFVANPRTSEIDAMANFRVSGKIPELWWPDTGRMVTVATFEERDGVTRVPLDLEPAGSVFVVFRKDSKTVDSIVSITRGELPVWGSEAKTPDVVISKATYGVPGDATRIRDVADKIRRLVEAGELAFQVARMADGDDPAYGTMKTLTVEYVIGGKTKTATATDPQTIDIVLPLPDSGIAVETAADGQPQLFASRSGNYVMRTAKGKTLTAIIADLPTPKNVVGPWKVRFDPAAGGPGVVDFRIAEDWAKRPEDGVRHYPGTAIYRTSFTLNDSDLRPDRQWWLDLGRVEVMAEVKINGKNLGILWKAPYRADATAALKPGRNELEIEVTNLWINRQIGDESLPEDSDRNANGTLKSWPDWVTQGKTSPTGRYTFASWRLLKKTDPLQPSGLLGPVTLQPVSLATPK